MEPTQLISDDLLNSSQLEHHGVKGMKWGVWNAETRAKYIGGSGRKLSKGVKQRSSSASDAVARFAKKKLSELKSSHDEKKKAKADERAAKKQNKQDIIQQRKDLGMSKAQYNKLRETTLKSHDPKVVARGMHTLTDMELDEKLNRLKKEDQIARLSSEQQTRKHQEHKARSEAIKANPVYTIGMNVAGRAIKNISKGLVDIDSDKKTKKKKNVENGAEKTESANKSPKANAGNESASAQQKSGTGSSAKSYVDSDRVRKVVRESAVRNEQVSSDTVRSAATRGERLITDGKLRAEIIDVTPVSYSSERQEKRKALPAGKE